MVLNSDLIKTAEASPDTMLTLINGEKLIVRESLRRDDRARARLPRAPVGRGGPAAASYGEQQRVVAIASLDVSSPASPPAAARSRDAQEDSLKNASRPRT
jgi:hypothetical protein